MVSTCLVLRTKAKMAVKFGCYSSSRDERHVCAFVLLGRELDHIFVMKISLTYHVGGSVSSSSQLLFLICFQVL